jgi:hypothetical protein
LPKALSLLLRSFGKLLKALSILLRVLGTLHAKWRGASEKVAGNEAGRPEGGPGQPLAEVRVSGDTVIHGGVEEGMGGPNEALVGRNGNQI